MGVGRLARRQAGLRRQRPGQARSRSSTRPPTRSLASVEVGQRPWGIALTPDGRKLYTANGPSNDVSVVDTEKLQVIKKIPVGKIPWGVAIGQAPGEAGCTAALADRPRALACAGRRDAGPDPSAFRFEPDARPSCTGSGLPASPPRPSGWPAWRATIDGRHVRISACASARPAGADSLGVAARASLEACGPPRWQGTVHTHVALRDGQRPYSLFSGADRGVMMLCGGNGGRRTAIFCLLYTRAGRHTARSMARRGRSLFPRSRLLRRHGAALAVGCCRPSGCLLLRSPPRRQRSTAAAQAGLSVQPPRPEQALRALWEASLAAKRSASPVWRARSGTTPSFVIASRCRSSPTRPTRWASRPPRRSSGAARPSGRERSTATSPSTPTTARPHVLGPGPDRDAALVRSLANRRGVLPDLQRA